MLSIWTSLNFSYGKELSHAKDPIEKGNILYLQHQKDGVNLSFVFCHRHLYDP